MDEHEKELYKSILPNSILWVILLYCLNRDKPILDTVIVGVLIGFVITLVGYCIDIMIYAIKRRRK